MTNEDVTLIELSTEDLANTIGGEDHTGIYQVGVWIGSAIENAYQYYSGTATWA